MQGGYSLVAGIPLLIGLIVVGIIGAIVITIIGAIIGWDSKIFIYGIVISGLTVVLPALWFAYRTRD